MKFYKRDPDRALAGMLELTMKQRGAYNSLLDLLYSRDGDVPDDDVRVARMMGCHWREWSSLKKQLMDAGKIWSDGGKLCAKRVEKTLREASETSREQRKRAAETPQRRRRDAAETPHKSEKPNEINDPDLPLIAIDRIGSTNVDPPPVSPPLNDSAESNATAKKRGTRLPDDWVPSQENLDYAREWGFSDEQAQRIALNFRDCWTTKTGAGAVKRNWDRVWQTWVRGDADGRGTTRGHGGTAGRNGGGQRSGSGGWTDTALRERAARKTSRLD